MVKQVTINEFSVFKSGATKERVLQSKRHFRHQLWVLNIGITKDF